jgi:hypothetical protein
MCTPGVDDAFFPTDRRRELEFAVAVEVSRDDAITARPDPFRALGQPKRMPAARTTSACFILLEANPGSHAVV